MKAIRRSLKNDKSADSRASHQARPSLHQKSPTAIIPPKKVIKALYDYEPTNKNGEELAFHKGDFFHVISREDDTEWYEACNPLLPAAKGLVPVAFFEVIGKQQRQSAQSISSAPGHDSGFSEKGLSAATTLIDHPNLPPSKPASMHSRGPSTARAGAMVYGIVLYDFNAERADELDARKGEAIIVVAQSNPEWFVAKPIGRLGGPGLIPVSFVEIKDTMTGNPVTDPLAAVKAAGVPRVEEWKRTAAEYKNSSISLGQINTPQIGGAQQITQSMDRMSLQNQQKQPQTQQSRPPQQAQRQQPPPSQPQLLAPIQASVPRYCFDNDMYWYIIEAQMSDGRWWELSRYYADFYDFQIALLEKFPEEAGNKGKPRSLPFMPGPVAHVTDAISNGRRQNLDEYIKKIVEQPDYIREDMLVRQLFAPRPGQDYEIDPSALEDDYRLSGHSLAQTRSRQSSSAASMQQSQHSAYGGMPPPGAMRNGQAQIPGHQPRPSQSYGPPPNGGQPMPSHPALHTQASNLTTNSTGTSSSATAAKPGEKSGETNAIATGPQVRIKLETSADIIAIRVPETHNFEDLMAKIIHRLTLDDVPVLKYRDDNRGTVVDLKTEADWAEAKKNRNLRILVNR